MLPGMLSRTHGHWPCLTFLFKLNLLWAQGTPLIRVLILFQNLILLFTVETVLWFDGAHLIWVRVHSVFKSTHHSWKSWFEQYKYAYTHWCRLIFWKTLPWCEEAAQCRECSPSWHSALAQCDSDLLGFSLPPVFIRTPCRGHVSRLIHQSSQCDSLTQLCMVISLTFRQSVMRYRMHL